MVGHHRWSWSDPEQQEDGPDGLTLKLSPASATGYFNVVKIGKKYYAKISQTSGYAGRCQNRKEPNLNLTIKLPIGICCCVWVITIHHMNTAESCFSSK